MGDWVAKLEFEQKLFNKRINELLLLSDKATDEILKEVSISFIQRAANSTPESKDKKRNIIELDKKTWLVPFSRIGEKGKKYFHDKGEAEAFRTITYRGVNRAGWAGNLLNFGKTPKIKSTLKSLLNSITQTIKGKKEIIIKNRVKNIGSWADYTLKEGLFKANNSLKWQIRNLENKIMRTWR